ncbi:MAG: NAD(P)/FAD-dependent oxidoreductase [Xanthomonadales bacterium]|nr:NAD(P)/FAD-dependent oxidoreductase [Xanthomonadales bacterium]
MTQSAPRPRVVILGGGFGGLWAARGLAAAPVEITLVDRNNHHLFQPLLYQVATAGLSAADIAAPLRHVLRGQRNVTVRLDEVVSIEVAAKQVHCQHGTLDYDWLIVATGATHAYFGQDAWAEHAPGLKTLEDAMRIRQRVLEAFEAAERAESPTEAAEWLRFAVIGGGPTGVELAGTLIEIARHTLPKEFRRVDPRQAEVHLIEAGPRILAAMPESLSDSARRQIEALGVRVHLGRPVTAIDAQGLSLGAERVPVRTILWAAGVAASPLGRQLAAQSGAATDRAGRVEVAADLSLPGAAEVYVIGDLARVLQDGQPVPGVAPAAKQMGAHVARQIRARVAGRPSRAFRYRDYGNLATIGRMAAVVDLRGLKFSGLLAWWFWLFAHLLFLIGFRNRLLVLTQWAFSYWTYQRHARIYFRRPTPRAPDGAPPSSAPS